MHAIFLQHLASPPFVVWRPRPHVPEAASPAASAVQPHVLQAPPRGCNRVLRVAGLIGLRARACRGGGEREHAQPRAVGVLRHVAHAHLAHARQGGGQARRPLPYRRHRERQADQLRPCDALPRARAHGERPHALVQDRHGLPAHHGASQGELHRRCHRVQGCSDQHCRRVPRHPLRPAGASSKCDVALCSLPTAHCPLLTAHCSLLTAHCSLPTAHCSLLTTHCSLLTTHRSLLTTHRSPLYTCTCTCSGTARADTVRAPSSAYPSSMYNAAASASAAYSSSTRGTDTAGSARSSSISAMSNSPPISRRSCLSRSNVQTRSSRRMRRLTSPLASANEEPGPGRRPMRPQGSALEEPMGRR